MCRVEKIKTNYSLINKLFFHNFYTIFMLNTFLLRNKNSSWGDWFKSQDNGNVRVVCKFKDGNTYQQKKSLYVDILNIYSN